MEYNEYNFAPEDMARVTEVYSKLRAVWVESQGMYKEAQKSLRSLDPSKMSARDFARGHTEGAKKLRVLQDKLEKDFEASFSVDDYMEIFSK